MLINGMCEKYGNDRSNNSMKRNGKERERNNDENETQRKRHEIGRRNRGGDSERPV